MYDIYIKNYMNPDGTEINSEQLLYSIPVTNSMNVLIEPTVKLEMGKAGNFEFELLPKHMYYNGLYQMKTIFRIVYDGDTIFRGRVLTIDDTLKGNKKVHCEGDLAFLLDSVQESVKEENRNSISILTYLKQLIYSHNLQMAEVDSTDKNFVLGEVPGQYSNEISEDQKITCEDRKYGSGSWETTLSALESLQKDFGGYFRTRYVEENYEDSIGQYGSGNIDLNNRTPVYNDDGSFYTEKSISTTIDDTVILLPTIIQGAVVSEDDAIQHYQQTGEYLGKFSTVAEAEDYAERLYERQQWYYNGQNDMIVKRVYLDWLNYWFDESPNTQILEVGENLIDMQNSTEVDNIFTALIPIGSNNGNDVYISGYKTDIHGSGKRILVPQIVSEFSDDELNFGFHKKEYYEQAVDRYGIIYKVEKFENANTQEKLWEYAIDWIRENYTGGITSFTVSALDLHHIEDSIPKYLVGDRLTIRYPTWNKYEQKREIVEQTMALTSVSYNLHSPGSNQYNVGIPNSILDKTYGSSNSNGGSSGMGGNNQNDEDAVLAGYDEMLTGLDAEAWTYVINAKRNNEIYQTYLAKDKLDGKLDTTPPILQAVHTEMVKVIEKGDGVECIPTILADGQRGRLDMIPPGVLEHVINNPEVEKAAIRASAEYHDAKRAVTLDALSAYFGISGDNSQYTEAMAQALNNLEIPEDITQPDLVKLVQDTVSGLGLEIPSPVVEAFANNINLDNIYGEFNMNNAENGNVFHVSSENEGSAQVGKDSESGSWHVLLNNTVTYTDQDGNEQTKSGFVSAQDFNLPTINSFKTKMAVIDTLIANKANINTLEALIARIETLEADYIKAAEIESMIASLDVVKINSLTVSGNFKFNSRYVYWMQTPIAFNVRSSPPSLNTTDSYTFVTKDGKEVTGKLVQTFSSGYITPTLGTLRYLGISQ